MAVVVGGGNIYRGLVGRRGRMDRATGDYMGMLATVLNALALQDALEKAGAVTRVLSALHIREVAEPYIQRRAIRHLEKGRVVIFAAGTGNPFFTTDTAAAVRGLEIGAEAILMAKNGVEGVFTADPRADPDAEFIAEISHQAAIEQRLRGDGLTALSLCMDNELPIHVFNMDDEHEHRPDSVRRARGNGGEEWMSDDLIKDFLDEAAGRMKKSVEATRARVLDRPHRPRLAAPARPHRGRLLRRHHAAAPARPDLRQRGAPAHDHPLRQELDQGDREVDPRVRRRA